MNMESMPDAHGHFMNHQSRKPERRPEMNATLRHEIDAAILENDLDALTEMLSLYEDDDNLRYILHEAIDRVSANLDNLHIEADVFQLTNKVTTSASDDDSYLQRNAALRTTKISNQSVLQSIR